MVLARTTPNSRKSWGTFPGRSALPWPKAALSAAAETTQTSARRPRGPWFVVSRRCLRSWCRALLHPLRIAVHPSRVGRAAGSHWAARHTLWGGAAGEHADPPRHDEHDRRAAA